MSKRRTVGSAQVRAWAKENGYEVGQRGRFSTELIQAFRKANPGVEYSANHVEKRAIQGMREAANGRKIPVRVHATLAEVRAFAEAEGLTVGKRGRVSSEVLAAFAARPKVSA